MSINQLYHTWFERITQLRPGERITRLRNLTWLIVGIFQSRSVHLNKIATKIPGQAKQLSIVRRLSRFLANPALRPRPVEHLFHRGPPMVRAHRPQPPGIHGLLGG